MSTLTIESRRIVDEVVVRLTGPAAGGPGSSAPLRARLRRAASEFDESAASAVGGALVESLCEEPDDVRRLEALVLLGLAHPGVLEARRISLAAEGRRLAVLLERSGDPERAQCLLDLVSERASVEDAPTAVELEPPAAPDTVELAEHCLRNADEAVARGANSEAIAWLRQILRADPGRRDVARMVRDLDRRIVVRRADRGRRWKLAAAALLLSGIASALAAREARIGRDWSALPQAEAGNAASLEARASAIDALLARERVWLGMFAPLAERERLRGHLQANDGVWTPSVLAAVAEPPPVESRDERAEESRQRGLRLVERGRYADALADLRRSLEQGSPEWPNRARVEADVAALQVWREKVR